MRRWLLILMVGVPASMTIMPTITASTTVLTPEVVLQSIQRKQPAHTCHGAQLRDAPHPAPQESKAERLASLLPARVLRRHAHCARSIAGRLRVGFVQEEHSVGDVAAARDRTQRRAAVETSVHAGALVPAERAGALAGVRPSIRSDQSPLLSRHQSDRAIPVLRGNAPRAMARRAAVGCYSQPFLLKIRYGTSADTTMMASAAHCPQVSCSIGMYSKFIP